MTQVQMSLTKPTPIFHNTNFLILWLGQLVSKLGDSFFYFATTIWMISSVGLEKLAILMAITAIPRIVLGPIAGTVVDRVNRKTVIWLSDFLRGALMLLGSLVIISGEANIYYFYLIFIASNVISTFFDPAISAVLPNIIDKTQLSQANSVRQGTSSFSEIIGPVLASIMFVSLGGIRSVPILIMLNGISFILSGISELFLDIPQLHLEKVKNTTGSVFKSFLAQLKEGFVYVRTSQLILRMLVVFAIMNFFLVPIFQLIVPAVIIDKLDAESWLGFIQASIAIGFILAAVFLSIKKSKTHYSLLLGGLLGLGVSILGLGMAIAILTLNVMGNLSILLLLVTISICVGISAATANIKLSTVMQIIVPDEVRGRVFALMNTLGAGLIPLSLALTGLVTIKLPLYFQPILGGISVILAAILFSRIKELKDY